MVRGSLEVTLGKGHGCRRAGRSVDFHLPGTLLRKEEEIHPSAVQAFPLLLLDINEGWLLLRAQNAQDRAWRCFHMMWVCLLRGCSLSHLL
jgi:hypothetical protein